MSMSDLVIPCGAPYRRGFFGPDGSQYTWCQDDFSNNLVLNDSNGSEVVIFRPIFPAYKYNIGEVYGELAFTINTMNNAPLTDMICLTAMLNRILNQCGG